MFGIKLARVGKALTKKLKERSMKHEIGNMAKYEKSNNLSKGKGTWHI